MMVSIGDPYVAWREDSEEQEAIRPMERMADLTHLRPGRSADVRS